MIGSMEEWVSIAKAQEGASEAGADGCLATFYRYPVHNKVRSEKEGRAVYDELPFVKILIPGQNKSIVEREVKEEDKQRWPDAWARFERNETGTMSGTPLEHWAFLSAGRVMEMKALGIYTLEQLVAIPDGNIAKLGPDGRDIVKRAQQFLKPQSDRETELRGEVEKLKQEVRALSARLDEANRQLSERKRRGRPPKHAA